MAEPQVAYHYSPQSTSSQKIFQLKDLSHRFGAKIWTLTFDLPGEKVNKFNEPVMAEFSVLLKELQSKAQSIDALILVSPKKDIFIAGADIKLIQAAKTAEQAIELASAGQNLLNHWEDLPFPTIAAINGAALGGGCEMSLASTAIVMSNGSSAKIGLPEVMLGVIPGMGGCVRLPTRVGIANALDLILTSKTLDGERAYRMGLVDACLPKENFEENVLVWVSANLESLKAGKRLAKEPKLGGMGGMMGKVMESAFRPVIFNAARKGVLQRTHGHYPAALKVIEVIQGNGIGYRDRPRGATRSKVMKREALGFGVCAATDVSKNLIRLFFLTEDVKKSNGLTDSSGSNAATKEKSVDMAAVLGAGVMGGGVAQLFADKDIPTRMKDISVQALTTGLESAMKIFKKKLKTKRLNLRGYQKKINLITPTIDFNGFKSVDVVVEAIIEKMDIKKKVFQDLENHVTEDCVIATNTSSLSVGEMQTVFKKPERFVGMHFFNPVHKMPLIEVIRGPKTSDQAVATIFQFSKKIGKTPIVVKDAPGFLVNRLLVPYMNEAIYLFSDGLPPEEIDAALVDFGMPMGPLELVDEVGVDVGEKVLHILHEGFGPRMVPAAIVSKITATGRLGKKNKKGIYLYEGQGDRLKKIIDPTIYSITGVQAKPKSVPKQEIVERCILPMINEASRCLEEHIVERPEDVDLGMIMGTGFPPFRGGLLRYADSLGPKKVVELLKKHQHTGGARFEPSSAMLKRAEKGEKFYRS